MTDVLVVGGGPAGLAAAAACAGAGLRVRCFDPAPRAPWPNNYGMWADDLPAPHMCSHRWDEVLIELDHKSIHLARPMVRIDAPVLRDALQATLPSPIERGTAVAAEHDATGSTVHLADGASIRAAVVIDASGHRPRLLDARPPATIHQIAYGRSISTDTVSAPMTLMDWRGPEHAGPPSFLYAMPLDERRLFVEETVLATTDAVSMATLQERLTARLARMRIDVHETLAEERCVIPMNPALPAPQRVVGFGASAAMVHPATGYMLANVLRRAPDLAAALCAGLTDGGPRRAAALAWDALWPPRARRNRQFFLLGADLLTRLSRRGLQRFFQAFFAMPEETWHAYLAGDLDLRRHTPDMFGLLVRGGADAWRALVRAGLSARHHLPLPHLPRTS